MFSSVFVRGTQSQLRNELMTENKKKRKPSVTRNKFSNAEKGKLGGKRTQTNPEEKNGIFLCFAINLFNGL
jgi:hypothetical protein